MKIETIEVNSVRCNFFYQISAFLLVVVIVVVGVVVVLMNFEDIS